MAQTVRIISINLPSSIQRRLTILRPVNPAVSKFRQNRAAGLSNNEMSHAIYAPGASAVSDRSAGHDTISVNHSAASQRKQHLVPAMPLQSPALTFDVSVQSFADTRSFPEAGALLGLRFGRGPCARYTVDERSACGRRVFKKPIVFQAQNKNLEEGRRMKTRAA